MADFRPPLDADPMLVNTQRALLLNQVSEHEAKIAAFVSLDAPHEPPPSGPASYR